MLDLITREAFVAKVRDGDERDVPGSLAKSYSTEVKAADDPESRTLLFTISTGAVDRYGDVVDPEGWRLDAFRKNPVVLWAHDGGSLPVARADQVWIEDGALKANATFPAADLSPFADKVFRFLKGGFLFATSVGFMPIKWAWNEDRGFLAIDFIEQELLEFSVVSVPANPEVLIEDAAPPIVGKDGPEIVAPEIPGAPWRLNIERMRLENRRRA